jgi:dTMP kinase
MPQLAEGFLIAIDGIDGAGKTTQCKLLNDWLLSEGFSSIVIKEPSKDGKYAREIRSRSEHRFFDHLKYTPEYELNLFIEDRKENVEKRIRPNLEDNNIVIMDRYYFSTIAYQSALGIDKNYIKKINEEFAPIPDVTIILDVTPQIGIKRINGRGDTCNSFEKKEYLEKVRKIFLDMKDYPNLHIIEGDHLKNSQDVFRTIKEIVEPELKKKLYNEGKFVVYQ